ncbi:hypothetical protein GIB67_036755 [Kingdonia uniflora]|uniref:Fe2OG dioxygenase domain-containing protein n=1 Tax=Kingdonia uniflora TaxID=39325 RepID=A0A7J7LWK7_9MAGN|nr:hypothetical protein GIB67_036755 [Kingdonia uniflora]
MNILQEWSEPITRVQSLSDSGSPAIPDRYVKPLSERPSLSSGANPTNIPVIDLGGLVGHEAKLRALTLKNISLACREWGFFQVINHGVSLDLIHQAREVWRQFFHLPIDKKQVYANSPRTYEGKVIEEYSFELTELSRSLMNILSVNLGLGEGYLQNAFGGDDIGACLRATFYPKCPQPDLTLGLSSHSDPGGMTLLLPDDQVSGLQVRKGDSWITVKPAPNAFIVNIGDQIEVLSNAIFKSVEHRVIVNSTKERVSLAFFYNPKSNLLIQPAKELVTPYRPALYQPMTFDEYRLYIRSRGPRGKSQVESLKCSR